MDSQLARDLVVGQVELAEVTVEFEDQALEGLGIGLGLVGALEGRALTPQGYEARGQGCDGVLRHGRGSCARESRRAYEGREPLSGRGLVSMYTQGDGRCGGHGRA